MLDHHTNEKAYITLHYITCFTLPFAAELKNPLILYIIYYILFLHINTQEDHVDMKFLREMCHSQNTPNNGNAGILFKGTLSVHQKRVLCQLDVLLLHAMQYDGLSDLSIFVTTAALKNPEVVAKRGGLSTILKSVIDCQLSRINEALITTVLHLLNHPRTRRYVRVDIELEVRTHMYQHEKKP